MGTPRRPDGIIVALDGPAGSGKSSTARAVAAQLGYRHLDSGAFYRAITLAAMRAGIEAAEWPALGEAELTALGVEAVAEPDGYRLTVHGEDATAAIRDPQVNARVARMAAIPAVREWLLGALRAAGERGGLVADGRDIGTVVFPDAEAKVFLVADPEIRARRRLAEQGTADPAPALLATEVARLRERDDADTGRAVAPLRQAEDAVVLDTSVLEFHEQVASIVRLAESRRQA